MNSPELVSLCFCRKLQVSEFIVWASFVMLLGSVCFWLSCMHVFCGPWHMYCVFFIHISFFWVMHVKPWCSGKFPGHPDPQIMHVCPPPLFILPISRVITCLHAHTHPSAPIYTLNMLIIVWYIWLNKHNHKFWIFFLIIFELKNICTSLKFYI